MQSLVTDSHGTLRFKQNQIVRKLLDFSTAHGYGLNEMAHEEFTAEDRMQLAQLIGYSLSGYGTLSYVTDESYNRAAASEYGNSPAIPDGWVLVPVKPTEDMVIAGFESKPAPFFSDPEEWKAYDEISGCQQAAHRAELCCEAMLAAAPRPE